MSNNSVKDLGVQPFHRCHWAYLTHVLSLLYHALSACPTNADSSTDTKKNPANNLLIFVVLTLDQKCKEKCKKNAKSAKLT